MINILPTKEKKGLIKEYRLRLATIHLIFISTMLLIASSLLIPSYIYSQGKTFSIQERLKSFNDTHLTISEEDLSKVINEINNNLTLLDKNKSLHNVSADALSVVLKLRPKGVTYTQIFYIEKSETNRTIDIQGTASDRNALKNLQTALESDPRISNVDLPVSSFTKKTNIDFKVTIKFK